MKTVVSEKGQVTIPKPLRDSLRLTPGTELDFSEERGVLVGRRVQRADPLDSLVGILPAMEVDAVIAGMRGPAWRADVDRNLHGRRRR